MDGRQLHHMYQAWMQGNENYIRDWAKFVEWAAHWNSTTGDVVMRELQKHEWFKWGDQ
jgi:hypothetical protein